MAKVRIEWIILGPTPKGLGDPLPMSTIQKVLSATNLTVSSTVTLAAERPVVPIGATYARIVFLQGNSIVQWGADPTASQTNGIYYAEGQIDAVPVVPGQKFSFVEYTA